MLTNLANTAAAVLGEVNVMVHRPATNVAALRMAAFAATTALSNSFKINPLLSSVEGVSSAMLGSEAVQGSSIAKVLEDARKEEVNYGARQPRNSDDWQRRTIEDLKLIMESNRVYAEAVYPQQYYRLTKLISDPIEFRDLTWLGIGAGLSAVLLGTLGWRRAGDADVDMQIDGGGGGDDRPDDPPPPQFPGLDEKYNAGPATRYIESVTAIRNVIRNANPQGGVVPSEYRVLFESWARTLGQRAATYRADLAVPMVGAGMIAATGISLGMQYVALGTALTGGIATPHLGNSIRSAIGVGLGAYTNQLRIDEQVQRVTQSNIVANNVRNVVSHRARLERDAKEKAIRAEEDKKDREALKVATEKLSKLHNEQRKLRLREADLENKRQFSEARTRAEDVRETNMAAGLRANRVVSSIAQDRERDEKARKEQMRLEEEKVKVNEKIRKQQRKVDEMKAAAIAREAMWEQQRQAREARGAENTRRNDEQQAAKARATALPVAEVSEDEPNSEDILELKAVPAGPVTAASAMPAPARRKTNKRGHVSDTTESDLEFVRTKKDLAAAKVAKRKAAKELLATTTKKPKAADLPSLPDLPVAGDDETVYSPLHMKELFSGTSYAELPMAANSYLHYRGILKGILNHPDEEPIDKRILAKSELARLEDWNRNDIRRKLAASTAARVAAESAIAPRRSLYDRIYGIGIPEQKQVAPVNPTATPSQSAFEWDALEAASRGRPAPNPRAYADLPEDYNDDIFTALSPISNYDPFAMTEEKSPEYKSAMVEEKRVEPVPTPTMHPVVEPIVPSPAVQCSDASVQCSVVAPDPENQTVPPLFDSALPGNTRYSI